MARLLAVVLFASLLLAVSTNYNIRACYYNNQAQDRSALGKLSPRDIDPFLCTHLIYAYARLDSNHQLAFYQSSDAQLYAQCNDKNDPTSLKSLNPDLKTLLSVGGWGANSLQFSDMALSVALRKTFARTSVDFLRYWGFDGLDLAWNYPSTNGGRPVDKDNFIHLIKECLDEFNKDPIKPRLLLTAFVAASKANIDVAYNIPEMAYRLDFINLSSHGFTGYWDTETGLHSALYPRSSESAFRQMLNQDWLVNYWLDKGTPKNKLILGLATYGRHFQLENPSNHNPGDSSIGGGSPGYGTNRTGLLAYYEICEIFSNGGTRYWEPEHRVPYLVSGDQWIGYDDEESILEKLNYIKDKQLGGANVWTLDYDDFNAQCSLSNRSFPLTSLIKEVLGVYTPPPVPTQGPYHFC